METLKYTTYERTFSCKYLIRRCRAHSWGHDGDHQWRCSFGKSTMVRRFSLSNQEHFRNAVLTMARTTQSHDRSSSSDSHMQ